MYSFMKFFIFYKGEVRLQYSNADHFIDTFFYLLRKEHRFYHFFNIF